MNMPKLFVKIFGVIMCAVFIMGTIQIPFVEAYENEQQMNDEATLMLALGKMDTDDAGNFNASHGVTRAELAYYVLKFFDIDASDSSLSKKFIDLNSDHPYYKHICKAYMLGMLDAIYTDFFSPDSEATVMEAARAILVGLGYQEIVKSIGDNELAYYKIANKVGLINGLKTSQIITKNTLALMFYRAMQVEFLISLGNGRYETTNQTMMDVMKIKRGTGRITANEYSHLVSSDSHVSKGKVLIDDSLLIDVGKTNAAQLLGFYVTYFYMDEGEPYLISVNPKVKDELKINAKDILSFDKSNGVLTYESGTDVNTVKISTTADVIYNGVACPNYTLMHLMPQSGYLLLYSSNGSGIYDTVFVTSYVNYVVDTVSVTDKIIYDKYGKTKLELDDFKTGYCNIMSQDGKTMSIEDIKANDVLAVQADSEIISDTARLVDTQNSKLLTIIVVRKSETGTVTSIESNDDKRIIGVNDKDLMISKSLLQEIKNNHESELHVGDYVTCYLDINGDIAGYKVSRSSEWKYGFLIKSQRKKGVANGIEMKLLEDSNKIVIVQSDEKLNIDGKSYKDLDDVDISQLQFKLIGYKKNSNGLITEIDTEYLGVNENSETSLTPYTDEPITCMYNKPSSVFDVGRGGRATFSLDSKAKVFVVPKEGYVDDDDRYASYGASYFSDYQDYYIKAYNLGDVNTAKIVVCYADAKPSMSYDIGVFMVKDIVKAVNAEGETVYKIYGSSQGKEITKICATTDQIEFRDYINTDKPVIKTTGISDLAVGDIIRTLENSKGETVGIDRMLSVADKLKPVPEQKFGKVCEEGGDSGYRKQFLTFYGKVYNRNGGLVILSIANDTMNPSELINVNFSKDFKVTCYDSKTQRVETVSLNDLVCYKNTRDYHLASNVFAYLKYSSAMDLFLIK